MILYYVKQFNLYYAGTDQDGTLRFQNVRNGAVAKTTREAAEKLCDELGNDNCEIEERNIG